MQTATGTAIPLNNIVTISPTSSIVNSSSQNIEMICPEQQTYEDNPIIWVNGKLLYWDYPLQYFLTLPGLEKSELSNVRSSYITIAPDNRYFATVNEELNDQGAPIIPRLDVLDFDGNIISSAIWKDNWGDGNPVWKSNNKILIDSTQPKTLIVYDPFSEMVYSKTFSYPDKSNSTIVVTDTLFRMVAYIFSDTEGTSGFEANNLSIWDEESQKEILNLKDDFSALLSNVKISNNEKMMAITTVTPNEMQDHSEIIIVYGEEGAYSQISDFRSHFDNILITNIQWSLSDQEIYFWAIINNDTAKNNTELFSVNIETKQIKHFCFRGPLDQENPIIWIPNDPGYYVVSSLISSLESNDSTADQTDILLIDSINNKAYKIAENLSLVGWLTPNE